MLTLTTLATGASAFIIAQIADPVQFISGSLTTISACFAIKFVYDLFQGQIPDALAEHLFHLGALIFKLWKSVWKKGDD